MLLSFRPGNHQEIIQSFAQQLQDNNLAHQLVAALIKDRKGLAQADGFRSLVFVLITFGLLWLLVKDKLKGTTVVVLLGLVTLVDLWSVDRRYLNTENFADRLQMNRQFNVEREVDRLIRMDKDPDYRVLDLTTNPFSDARASYFHKSIGGYHAAKLMRYQELIERQFSSAINEDVLDMLNTRYLIMQDNQDNERIQRRSSAAGNAWFVDSVTFVADDEAEMRALNGFNPLKEAFVQEQFKSSLNEAQLTRPADASIELTSYRPDHLIYEYSASETAFAVFSEIWYDKGWSAYIDGEKLPIVRANYLLRALQLPEGNHKVEFKFEPKSYHVGETISLIASLLMVVGVGVVIWMERRKVTPVERKD